MSQKEIYDVLQKIEKETEKPQLTMPRDFYAVNYPYGYVRIKIDKETGKPLYSTIEPSMTAEETQVLTRIKAVLKEEANVPLDVLKNESLAEKYLAIQIKRVMKTFRLKIPVESVEKFVYYVKRDFLGYGVLDIPMRDLNIEDISCNGVGIPIYVWHRYFESLPTNIVYRSREELDSFIMRLAYKTGHQISVSKPIMEGSLPEGFRVHLTLEDISKRGDTFTIRKVRSAPFTAIDLIKLGTMSPNMGAYFWILVENLRSIMIAGATASGKTAFLNSVAMFIRPEMKVVTIEEVLELRLHENWIPMVTRPTFQQGVQEVTLFDLLKSSLRQRPDYIIVGEIRGDEAYTLFQSISVGHGGLCTIHAEDVETVEKRLLNKPMNIPPMLIPMMNVVVLIRRIKLGNMTVRKVMEVSEIVDVDSNNRGVFKKIYEWDPQSCVFNLKVKTINESYIFGKISDLRHISIKSLNDEMEKREVVLGWMAKKNIGSYDEVANIVRKYYQNPDEVYKKARLEIEG